ncbi:MAG: hypothetical protein U9R27_03380 [Campylobacterota bacterium]|nr:hypothetical protein [Campylobacterota bacterium]
MVEVDRWFSYKLTRLSQYVDAGHLNDIKQTYLDDIQFGDKRSIENFIHFLFHDLSSNIEKAQKLTRLLQDFRKQLSHVSSDKERENIILEYAYELNPSKVELHKDELALKRWFDEDALAERISSKVALLHRRSIIVLERIGCGIELLTQEHQSLEELWHHFDFNKEFLYLIQYTQEPLLLSRSFSLLLIVVKCFDAYHDSDLLDERIYQHIYRIALSKKNSVWVQNSSIEFLAYSEIDSFLAIATIYAQKHVDDDTIFVRHKIATIALSLVEEHNEILPLIEGYILTDTSPYVRQAIAKQLPYISHNSLKYLKESLILRDPDPSVRALAILQSLKCSSASQKKIFYETIHKSLKSERDKFVLKCTIDTVGKLAKQIVQSGREERLFTIESISILSDMLLRDIDISLKRYASMVRESLWIYRDSHRYKRYEELHLFVHDIPVGESRALPSRFLEKPDELYRILSVISQDDFSLELRRTIFGATILARSERMGRRAWRIIYEFRNPSPDKREAFPHTIARIFEGTRHFPSSIMAEQAPTKVPGEPYYIPEEESSRPFLPIADHYLSSLKQSTIKINPFFIYSSDGVTTISPPKGFWRRWRAEWLLTWNYASIARLRNWQKSSTQLPSDYVSAMNRLGFKTTFEPYIKGDESSAKFFPLALPIPFLSTERQESIENYFISAYENSLGDLVLFIVVVFGLFFFRHVSLSWQIRRARGRIALSIGGWGTRGKSGTERLKAALFNALGLRVFSKTTGNEAMFLHSESFDGMREMYLFRPYDKATIWEQADTVLIADKLNVDVYLWESMGLTPSYVEVLQQRWMKDNIATITNTYPDHEDLQGPAGINIPQVMTNFIPDNSTLVTTEEVMYPILGSYAKSVNTPSFPTGWLQSGLIAPDILSRFPYEEHPHNIALVLVMAEQLDIDEDEALKAMADNIVPDLGVLKAYPPAQVETKKLLFINGMSANERFGALGNWNRMGLRDKDIEKNPDTYLTTVINNRADRVSRSRVFASMLVENVEADCHIIIGSNISGFLSYLDETWSTYQQTISLVDEDSSMDEKLMSYAKKYRLIRGEQQLIERLKIMLNASDIEPSIVDRAIQNYDDISKLTEVLSDYTEILLFYQQSKDQYDKLERFRQKLGDSSSDDLNQEFRDMLWIWLKDRFKPLYNYHATGNEVVQNIADHTPPGMLNTIIGMQNIKGTGLDFAYRWVAWGNCYRACQAIKSTDSKEIQEGVETLAAFEEHGPLTFALTRESIEIAREAIATQNDYYQAQIQIIEKNLNKSIDASKNSTVQAENQEESDSRTSWREKILEMVESFLDAGDAVKRRKRANLIYKDLINYHISHKKAAIELQAITKRQKGGWFVKRFSS